MECFFDGVYRLVLNEVRRGFDNIVMLFLRLGKFFDLRGLGEVWEEVEMQWICDVSVEERLIF